MQDRAGADHSAGLVPVFCGERERVLIHSSERRMTGLTLAAGALR
jgi:hypothetical protein